MPSRLNLSPEHENIRKRLLAFVRDHPELLAEGKFWLSRNYNGAAVRLARSKAKWEMHARGRLNCLVGRTRASYRKHINMDLPARSAGDPAICSQPKRERNKEGRLIPTFEPLRDRFFLACNYVLNDSTSLPELPALQRLHIASRRVMIAWLIFDPDRSQVAELETEFSALTTFANENGIAPIFPTGEERAAFERGEAMFVRQDGARCAGELQLLEWAKEAIEILEDEAKLQQDALRIKIAYDLPQPRQEDIPRGTARQSLIVNIDNHIRENPDRYRDAGKWLDREYSKAKFRDYHRADIIIADRYIPTESRRADDLEHDAEVRSCGFARLSHAIACLAPELNRATRMPEDVALRVLLVAWIACEPTCADGPRLAELQTWRADSGGADGTTYGSILHTHDLGEPAWTDAILALASMAWASLGDGRNSGEHGGPPPPRSRDDVPGKTQKALTEWLRISAATFRRRIKPLGIKRDDAECGAYADDQLRRMAKLCNPDGASVWKPAEIDKWDEALKAWGLPSRDKAVSRK